MPAGTKTGCSLVDAELDRHFGTTGAPAAGMSQQTRAHLEECGRCRALYGYLIESPPALAVSRELQGKISSTLQQSLQPVKPVGSVRVLTAQLLVIFLIVALAATGMMNAVGIAVMKQWQLIGIIGFLAVGAAFLSLSLAWQMTPGSLRRVPATTALTILAASFLVGVAILFPWQTPEGFFRFGWHCLRVGLMMAGPAAVLFGILVWRGAPLGFGMLGATLGAIAGLLSVTILQFTCDHQDAIHLVAWHGGVLAISTLMGIVIGLSVRRFHFHA